MSETSSYSSVSSVESVGTSSSSSSGFATLLGGLLFIAGAGLVAAAASSSRQRRRLESPDAVRMVLDEGQRTTAASTRVTAARTAALASIQGAAVPQGAAPVVEKLLLAVQQAPTLKAVQTVRAELGRVLANQHAVAFSAALSETCVRAAARLDYTRVAVSAGPGGVQRIVAKNAAGHALVTEVSVAADGRASMKTEVFGTKDPECGRVLSAHGEALKAEGLRAPDPHRRKTGGVAQLDATIANLRDLLTPPMSPRTHEPPPTTPSGSTGGRRAGAPSRVKAGR